MITRMHTTRTVFMSVSQLKNFFLSLIVLVTFFGCQGGGNKFSALVHLTQNIEFNYL